MNPIINVIDLDKTLIPYDSFRLLVKNELKLFNIYVSLVTILRLFKIVTSNKYKEIISKHLYQTKNEIYFLKFADRIYNDINQQILAKIKERTDDNTTNILLSASPNLYVKFIVTKLGWTGSGSYFDDNNKFVSLYASGKIKWLEKNYPHTSYNYNFAISDSKSDLELLSLFNEYELWISH